MRQSWSCRSGHENQHLPHSLPHHDVGAGPPDRSLVQGCSIRCSGCISADTWAKRQGELELGQILEHLEEALSVADGITISGGEPFDQAEALAALLQALRQRTAFDILVYSGYAFEEIAGIFPVFEGLIDALISEPFLLHAPQTLPLRGSDNQRLHLLTELGRSRFAGFDAPSPHSPVLDVMFDADGVWFAGIPRRGDFQRLASRLREAGHFLPQRKTPPCLERCMTERISSCGTRRPQHEMFCQAFLRDGICEFPLAQVPIEVPLAEPAPATAKLECINGHTLNQGDFICGISGADLAPDGFNESPQEPYEPKSQSVDGWEVESRLPGSGATERFRVRGPDGAAGLLTLYPLGIWVDASVDFAVNNLPASIAAKVLARGEYEGRRYEVAEFSCA